MGKIVLQIGWRLVLEKKSIEFKTRRLSGILKPIVAAPGYLKYNILDERDAKSLMTSVTKRNPYCCQHMDFFEID